MRKFIIALLLLTLAPLSHAVQFTPEVEFDDRALTSAAANNTDLAVVTCIKVRDISVQITGTFVATVSFQASNDGSNWGSVVAFPIGTVAGTPVTSTTATGHWMIPTVAKFIRVRTTAYTSGTVTGTIAARWRQTDLPTTQVSLSGTSSVNQAQIAGNTVSTGNGTSGTGVQRVAIASDNTAFTVNLGTGGTGATSLGKARDGSVGGTDTGVGVFFVRRDTPTAVTPAAGDYEIPQISNLGEVWVKDIGAGTTHHAISAATTNATSVKASAGTVNQIVVNNVNAAVRYFKLFNLAAAPTVGSSTPVLTLAIPAGQTVVLPLGPRGLRLGTGIAYALTTGIAVSDTGAVAANEHAVHISYE